METIRRKGLSMMCIILVAFTGPIIGSMEEDEKDCADQMAELATCIPFVSGSAKQPTKECCDDTNKVKNAKPKCLCVLIKESTNPSMGLPINTTLALQMPAICKIDAKVSDCPTLLNLPTDSPDAKIFKVANEDSSSSSTTTSPSDSSTSTKSPSTSTTITSGNTKTTGVNANNGAKSATSILFGIELILILLIFI